MLDELGLQTRTQYVICIALPRQQWLKERVSILRRRGRPKKNWMEGIKKAMNDRNLNEGQWEDRKQWSLGVGQRRKTF